MSVAHQEPCQARGVIPQFTVQEGFIQLATTYTYADWWWDGYGTISYSAGGSCWANPDTGISHWELQACVGELSYTWWFGLAATDNTAVNWDFGYNEFPTYITHSAYVYQVNGTAEWAVFKDDWGEGAELIVGLTTLGYSYC